MRLTPRRASSSALRPFVRRTGARMVPMGAGAPSPELASMRPASTYEVAHVQFRDQDAREQGLPSYAKPFAATGPFASVFVLPEQRERFAADVATARGFVWMDADEGCRVPVAAPPAVSSASARGDGPEAIVEGGRAGLTGEGVVIAVLSTGLDVRHPDFMDLVDGQPRSRLLWYWDTLRAPGSIPGGQPAPLTYPDGAPAGTLLDNAAVTGLLAATDADAPHLDPAGHGTALAGIAAGNGRASEGLHVGAAPKAALIGVRLGSGTGGRIENASLTGAVCRWLIEVAGGRPLVVLVGFGGVQGGRDGRLISERMLDQLFEPDARARALVVAAGDGGGGSAHASLALGGPGRDGRLAFRTRPGASSPYKTLTAWIEKSDPDEVWRVESGGTEPGGGMRILGQDAYFDPRSAQTVLRITAEGHAGYVALIPESGRAYVGDAWIEHGLFVGQTPSEAALVEAPATAAGALAVGAYDWNDLLPGRTGLLRITDGEEQRPMTLGALSPLSAPGLRRLDGRVKPDLAAPGRWFLAPRADGTDRSAQVVTPDGRYAAVGGTAAAAAYAAGVLALLFERRPDATWSVVRARLEAALSHDARTGSVPSARWGHGRLDLAAVDRLLGEPR